MRSPTEALPGWRALVVLTSLVLLTLLPSGWGATFLNFDDDFWFGARNDALRIGGLAHILDPRATIANAYLPVSHLSLWLDWQLFGARPRGPHLHSLLLHALAAFALAKLLARVGVAPRIAVLAAAVFAVHPALVESSLWVSSRKDLLSGLFAFLCLGSLARAARGETTPARATTSAVALALGAVYAKGTAIVLPLCGAVVVVLAGRSAERRATGRFRPWWGVLAVCALAAVHHAAVARAEGTMVAAGGGARLAQVPGAFLHYLATALWPAQLNVLYPEVATMERFAERLVPAALLLAAVAAAAACAARRRPIAAGGLLWFALALLPFNTAFPASAIAAADRYLYLAIPGLALAVVGLAPRLGPGLAALALLPLGLASADRASDFRSSEALWRASLAVDRDNAVAALNLSLDLLQRSAAPRDEIERLLEHAVAVARHPQHRLWPATQLAILAEGDGRLAAARRHAQHAAAAASELPPSADAQRLWLEATLRVARLARRDGELEAARAAFARAESAAPDHPLVLAFRAALLHAEAMDAAGRVTAVDPRRAAAMALLDRAEAAAPRLYEVALTRAQWGAAVGELLSAETWFRRALALEPLRAEAWLGRAALFLGQGMFAAAERAVREGLAAGVAEPGLLFHLALALDGQGRREDAREFLEAYLRVQPRDAAARRTLAAVLAASAMRDLYQLEPDRLDAIARRIFELDPSHPKAFVALAVVERHRKNMLEALVLLERAQEALPDDAEVRRLLAETLRDRGWQLLLQEQRRDVAFDHFRRFLATAPADVPTEAVLEAVRQEWKRWLARGQEALLAEDPAEAETSLRRCRALLPEETGPCLQLGMALLQLGESRWGDALAAFEQAAEGQRRQAADASLAVLYQLRALKLLGRADEARTRGRAFLAEAGERAAPDVVERIEAAIER
jgi:tetratricopeptide (TPR) repeat protein